VRAVVAVDAIRGDHCRTAVGHKSVAALCAIDSITMHQRPLKLPCSKFDPLELTPQRASPLQLALLQRMGRVVRAIYAYPKVLAISRIVPKRPSGRGQVMKLGRFDRLRLSSRMHPEAVKSCNVVQLEERNALMRGAVWTGRVGQNGC